MEITLEVLIAAFGAIVALIAWWTGYSHNRYTLESTAFSLVHESKSNLDQALIVVDENANYRQLIEDYLNAMNYACSLYLSKQIDKKRFVTLYKKDIIIIFKQSAFRSVIKKNKGDFLYLIKVHDKFIKK